MELHGSYDDLYKIVSRLRAPDGCPWDRKQTLDSMKNFLLEESYETVTAIQDQDTPAIVEELGDVFLILAMMIKILEEEELAGPTDVFNEIGAKLIRRHPHVFGNEEIHDAEAVKARWDQIKETLEGREKKTGVHAVPPSLPPLERSYKIQKRAAKTGFDWEDHHGPLEKVREEIAEIEEELRTHDGAKIESEIGDLLFSVVNLARKLKIDPMAALHGTNEKFLRRFTQVEQEMSKAGEPMDQANLELMDQYWNQAKERESR
jgi:tetrapyrrole methylase family protein/MazG family protein